MYAGVSTKKSRQGELKSAKEPGFPPGPRPHEDETRAKRRGEKGEVWLEAFQNEK